MDPDRAVAVETKVVDGPETLWYKCIVAHRGRAVHLDPPVGTKRQVLRGHALTPLIPRGTQGEDRDAREPVAPAEGDHRTGSSFTSGEIFVRAEDVGLSPEGFSIERSLLHGHVAACFAMVEKLQLAEVIGPACRERDIVMGLVAARAAKPSSKLAATRLFGDTTIGADLGLCEVSTDELYGAMDWLYKRQDAIEAALAARHLHAGSRVLYDLSSSWMEGTACPLVARGHSRDGKRGSLRSSTGCSPIETGVRSQSRSLRATPGTRARSSKR